MKEGTKKYSKKEETELKHRSRRLSIKEGIFWSIRSSLGDHYVAPFAIFTGMADSLVAILNSIWNLGPISQLFGGKIVGREDRKRTLTKSMSVDAFGWLIMAVIAVLYLNGIATSILPYLIILDFALIVIAGGLGHPAWFSWIGDIVDSEFRGRWFSKRSTIISFTTIILAVSAGFGLRHLKSIGQENLAFIILFSVAFLARTYCTFIIRRQYEPKLRIKKEKKFTLKHFIEEAKKTNLGKFTLFRGMFAIAVSLSSTLTSVYLLRYLQFDYVSYIIIMLSGTLFSVITLNLWGKIADKYGNYKVIAITTLFIPLTPLLWILSTSKLYLFLVPAILGGTTWTAFIMASSNFIYDNTKKETRGKAVSYFNLFTGVGALIGGLISAFLIKTINTTWIKPLYLIFLISMILRMLLVGFWVPKLKEIGKKPKLKNFEELENLIVKEIKPTLTEDVHEIIAIKDYINE